ncbi:orotidine-5'-phosphate decarboxylase [Legionella sp. km772]|uniref:orotidine-5'-phosphate decarboxylase n=1 Tax=Legionella sp. km772 TaxID=2498111 RepID=UPI000F8D9871|nr:orotidine-5'-phosphate decarboxylase [Legionella sp. km772]RUR12182.1 orotidine-5'-phosphate decarboxylase [Legionella sp. km772]
MTSKLIVALDIDNKNEALDLIDQLDPASCALKIGSEMFTLWGPVFVSQVIKRGFKVFLDLKFHDIPHTVARACKAGAELGVWMLNIHASGGLEMMQAAVKALEPYGNDKPLLIAVTVLTSFDESDLMTVGIEKPLLTHVGNLAKLAHDANLDGVVCSAHEVKKIKELCGHSFLTVTPGIRLPDNSSDDQSRIMTPKQAIEAGSDYLVMGRPITRAVNPAKSVREILLTMN